MRKHRYVVAGCAVRLGGWLSTAPDGGALRPALASARCARRGGRRREVLGHWPRGGGRQGAGPRLRAGHTGPPGRRAHIPLHRRPLEAAHGLRGRESATWRSSGNRPWIPEFAALGRALRRRLATAADRPLALCPAALWRMLIERSPTGPSSDPVWSSDTRCPLLTGPTLLAAAGSPAAPDLGRNGAPRWLREAERPARKAGRCFCRRDEWGPAPRDPGIPDGRGDPCATRGGTAAFARPAFPPRGGVYVSLFSDGFAPPLSNAQRVERLPAVRRGRFRMWITRAVERGEFHRRLPARAAGDLGNGAPSCSRPGAGGARLSLAGGRASPFSALRPRRTPRGPSSSISPSLPSRPLPTPSPGTSRRGWTCGRRPTLHDDRRRWRSPCSSAREAGAEGPEWESIAQRIAERFQEVLHGGATLEATLAGLDADADMILEKRRWMLDRRRPGAR